MAVENGKCISPSQTPYLDNRQVIIPMGPVFEAVNATFDDGWMMVGLTESQARLAVRLKVMPMKPAQKAQSAQPRATAISSFQSTPPRGGRRQRQEAFPAHLVFQSTPPARGATAKTAKILSCFYNNRTILTNISFGLPRFSKNRVTCSQKTPQTLVRNHGNFLCACASHLKHQDVLRVIRRLCSKMLNLVFIAVAQVVKAQAILFRIHDFA